MSLISINDINKLKEKIKQRGYKFTPQRKAVFDVIVENEGKHLTAEDIYGYVKENNPDIGLATVYRTVLLLEELGIIYRIELNDGCSRFELAHENETHRHHHLICTNCGKVLEVEDDLLENLELKIEEKYKFKIKDHSVKFFGLCSECRNDK